MNWSSLPLTGSWDDTLPCFCLTTWESEAFFFFKEKNINLVKSVKQNTFVSFVLRVQFWGWPDDDSSLRQQKTHSRLTLPAMHHGRSNGGTCSCGSSCFAPGSSGISVMAKRTDIGRCVSLNRYYGDRRPADSLHIHFVYHACTSIRAFANLLASASLRVTSLKFLLIIALAIAYL